MSAVIEGASTDAELRAAAEREAAFTSRLLRQPLTMVSAVVLLIVVVATVCAPLLAPTGPLEQDLLTIYGEPSPHHLLGTDQLGRDILSRMLYGGRVTLLGVVQAVMTCTLLGMLLGLAAGTLAGWTEFVVMRVADILLSVPGLVILLVVLAIFGQNESAAMITFGIIMSPTLIRVVYAATIAVREEPYVAGARVAGLNSLQIMQRHILPAVAGPALTQVSFVASLSVLAGAAIGFLGLGVSPPNPSWGNMVTDAQQAIILAPWMLVPTGGIIAVVALALTLIGNGIRDAYAGRSSGSVKAYSWRALTARVTREMDRRDDADARAQEAAPILSVKRMSIDLSHGKGEQRIVDGVSFDVRPGEALGIVGESGCGKSMSISGVLRVLPPGATLAAKSISFKGVELTSLSEQEMNAYRGTGIAFISQEPIEPRPGLHRWTSAC